MRSQRYLVGSKREKDKIEKLLIADCPAFVSYDYLELCTSLYEQLFDKRAETSEDFDYVLCDFLDEMELDIRERMGDWFTDFLPYLLNVEEAMRFFKKYLYTVNGMPVLPLMEFEQGTLLSVMTIVQNRL